VGQDGILPPIVNGRFAGLHIPKTQLAAPTPKFFRSRRRDLLHGTVPKAEMQLDGEGNIHIEKIPAPLPTGLPNQDGQDAA
jgi:hypothetical protein